MKFLSSSGSLAQAVVAMENWIAGSTERLNDYLRQDPGTWKSFMRKTFVVLVISLPFLLTSLWVGLYSIAAIIFLHAAIASAFRNHCQEDVLFHLTRDFLALEGMQWLSFVLMLALIVGGTSAGLVTLIHLLIAVPLTACYVVGWLKTTTKQDPVPRESWFWVPA